MKVLDSEKFNLKVNFMIKDSKEQHKWIGKSITCRDVFRILSNICDGAFFAKIFNS